MTTNEIAAAVQTGQADVLELWDAVQRFAHDRAYRWTRAAKGRGGAVLDDLVQCAFIALMEAGGWSVSHLVWPEAQNGIYRGHGAKDRTNPAGAA